MGKCPALVYDKKKYATEIKNSSEKKDPKDLTINHPQHYGGDEVYETIKVVEAWKLGFHLGNVIKYVARADKKGTQLEDLKKARWYLNREIENIEKKIGETKNEQ